MNKYYLTLIIGTIVLIFLQVFVLNHLWVFDYFMPILYLYPLLKMPLQSETWLLLIYAAVTGLVMDLLMNTPGLNMAAIVLAAYCRKPLLLGLISDDALEEEDGLIIPGTKTMKFLSYLLYLLILTVIHIGTLLSLEGFSLGLFGFLVPFILGGTAITVVIYLLFDLFSRKKRTL